MKSKGALTPQGTPDGDSISNMTNCGSGSLDLSMMDSECDSSIITTDKITNLNVNNIKKSKSNKNKMSQQYYFISFVVYILFLIVLTTNNFVLCDDNGAGSGYADVVTTEFSKYPFNFSRHCTMQYYTRFLPRCSFKSQILTQKPTEHENQ